MFEVKKRVSLDINITQAGLEALIEEKIKEQDPTIVVDSIEFINRRNPKGLDIEVSGHIDGMEVDETEEPVKKEPVEETGKTQKAVKEAPSQEEATEAEEEEISESEEVEEKVEETPPKKTVGSLFDKPAS